jgi:hypothetical protein
MTYLIVGLDRRTLAPWQENIRADDVRAGTRIALDHADAQGIDLVVAAVIGPNLSVLIGPHLSVRTDPAVTGRRSYLPRINDRG